MLAAKEGILDLRAAVGSQQETVERAKAQRVSEHDTLDLARLEDHGDRSAGGGLGLPGAARCSSSRSTP